MVELAIFVLGICAAVIGYLLNDTHKQGKVQAEQAEVVTALAVEIAATEQVLEATAPEAELAQMLNDLDK